LAFNLIKRKDLMWIYGYGFKFVVNIIHTHKTLY